jgi:hypothetical protein
VQTLWSTVTVMTVGRQVGIGLRCGVAAAGLLLAACQDIPEPVASATFEPALLDLGELPATQVQPPSGQLLIRNTGEVPLLLAALEVPEHAADWTADLLDGSLPTRLDPGIGLVVEVTWQGQPAPEAVSASLLAHFERMPDAEDQSEVLSEAILRIAFDCDEDEDGASADVCGGPDCDDLDPTRYAGATELCNGVDDDCDGVPLPDEVDADGDSYLACEDCDDEVATTWPRAPELCNGVDDDCDPATWAEGGETDVDGDGFLGCADCDDQAAWNSPGGAEVCDGKDNDCDGVLGSDELDDDGDGQTECEGDCDDADPLRHLGAEELCNGLDEDCDGAILFEYDVDGDGWRACEDCDDQVASTWPGAPELCDGVDDDCDGATLPGEVDADGDGFLACAECDDGRGDFFPGAVEVCDGFDGDCDGVLPADEVDGDGDGFLACAECDDGEVEVFPGAGEACNGVDDDCDGATLPDEVDVDGDGWLACAECDDVDGQVFPGAVEACNGVDDDCDGATPGEVDVDGDGWMACAECDDADSSTWPSAPELCDGVDNDCDGVVPVDEVDADGDGWHACLDCADDDPAIHPGVPDVCDGLDNDCDGVTDDLDGDGWDCVDDCDDGDPAVGAPTPEVCSGLDDDCDGEVDEDTLRVPEEFADIQAALDARMGPGEVVCVGPGTWPGTPLVFGYGVDLIGWAGSAATELTGGSVSSYALLLDHPGTDSLIQGFSLSDPARALRVLNSNASFIDIVVRDLTPVSTGAWAIYIANSDVDFTDLVLLDNEMGTGQRLMQIHDSSVTIVGLTMTGNVGEVQLNGNLGEPSDATLSVEDCLVTGNEPPGPGNGLFMGDGDYSFSRCEFSDNGGSVFLIDGALAVLDSSFEDIDRFAIAQSDGPALIERIRVVGVGAELTWQQDQAPVTFGVGGDLIIRDSIIAGNPRGGLKIGGRTGLVENVTIVGNSVNAGLFVQEADVVVIDSTITGNDLGTKIVVANSTVDFDHSNIWGNTLDFWGTYPDPTGTDGNISVDPQHLDTSSAVPADWDLHLSPTSPLVDAGSPALLDPDGSPSDIGAWGGPDADLWDLDGDGYPSWWQPGPYDFATYPAQGWDCDDLDPDVIPGDGC